MDLGIGLGAIVFGITADIVDFSVVYTVVALISLTGVLVTGFSETDC